jgi:hypothetical protein
MNEDKVMNKASKHFRMLINYCREKVQEGLVRVKHIATEENIADILTKNIFGQDFMHKRQRLLGMENNEEEILPVPSRRLKLKEVAIVKENDEN